MDGGKHESSLRYKDIVFQKQHSVAFGGFSWPHMRPFQQQLGWLLSSWLASGSHSGVSDSATPWTAAHQAPLSMGFPRHEHWSGLPLPSPEDLPNPGVEPGSPALWTGFLYHLSHHLALSLHSPGLSSRRPLHPPAPSVTTTSIISPVLSAFFSIPS